MNCSIKLFDKRAPLDGLTIESTQLEFRQVSIAGCRSCSLTRNGVWLLHFENIEEGLNPSFQLHLDSNLFFYLFGGDEEVQNIL